MEQPTQPNTRAAISEQTAKYVVAIQYLEETETAFLNAVCTHYGDTQGEQIYMEHGKAFDTLRDLINGYFVQSVTDNLRDTDSDKI